MMLIRSVCNNAALRCVASSLPMLKQPSSSWNQAVSFTYLYSTRTNDIQISSINNSTLVKQYLEKYHNSLEDKYLVRRFSFVVIVIDSIIIGCSV